MCSGFNELGHVEAPKSRTTDVEYLERLERQVERQETQARGRGRLRFTKRQASILKRLAAARGALVDRQTLLRDALGYHPDAQTHTLETHIWRIRQKIEADPGKPKLIVHEAGGYRLVLPD